MHGLWLWISNAITKLIYLKLIKFILQYYITIYITPLISPKSLVL